MSGSVTTFHEGRARAVQVAEAAVLGCGMDVFAGVILHMDTGDADLLRTVLGFDFQPAVLADGQVELGNLVAGREIRIKVVLAGENGALVDVAVRGQTHQGGVMHGWALTLGRAPGMPAQTSQVLVFGAWPKVFGQEQNSLDLVES